MKDVMKDLETLGVSAGCAVVSIGAVGFDEFGVASTGFYQAISIPDWDKPGLTAEGLRKEEDTIKWWQRPDRDKARNVFTDPDAVTLAEALDRFDNWFYDDFRGARVWGNGADFDLPILGGAYKALGRSVPWGPWNGRCYRTVKNQFKDVGVIRGGTYHNALDDAKTQAAHLVRICQSRGWRLI